MLKDIGFYHLQENIKKKLLDAGLDAVKTASKKLVHKASEYFGNKIVDAVTKSNDDKIGKQQPFEKIIILLEKRD